MKNQIILVNTIDFPLLVPQKLSVESSINDEVHQKSKFNHIIHLHIDKQSPLSRYFWNYKKNCQIGNNLLNKHSFQ